MKREKNDEPKRNNIPYAVLSVAILLVLSMCIYNFYLIRHAKLACFDTTKVLRAYKGVEELRKNYEDKNKLFNAQLDTLKAEFEISLKEYEKNRSKLSVNESKQAEETLRKKQNDYSSYGAANQESLKKEEMKVIEKTIELVNTKIKKFAKSSGYSAVIGSTPNGGLVYVSDYIDITDELIDVINN